MSQEATNGWLWYGRVLKQPRVDPPQVSPLANLL